MSDSPQSKDSVSPPASPTKPTYLNLTEDSAKDALIEARGDIFVASQLLGITVTRLHRAIRSSPALQATVDAAPALSVGIPAEKVRAAIEERVQLYRVSGLDALHDLATMPIDQNSAQNQVKLAAAARLAGAVDAMGGNDSSDILRELRDSYEKSAPRLRVVREKITIERLPPERVVAEGSISSSGPEESPET